MITITVDERTKAGRALLEAARIMAQHSTGIEFEDDRGGVSQMRKNNNEDILSGEEANIFLLDLRQTAKR